MSNISTFRSTREQTRTAEGDTVTGQAVKRVGSDSDLPAMKRTGQPKSAGGVNWGGELEAPGRQGLGEAGREGLGEVSRERLEDLGRQGLGEAGRVVGGGQAAAGVQEGSGQAGGAVVQEGLLRAGRGDSGLKTVAQQNLAGRRHRSHQPPYQFVGRYNNDTATVCYLNGAINVLTSSLLFNDTFFVIKSGGPLINQLHLICGSYPGQVRQLYIQGVPLNWPPPLNFLNKRSHVNCSEISLSARGYKGPVKRDTL